MLLHVVYLRPVWSDCKTQSLSGKAFSAHDQGADGFSFPVEIDAMVQNGAEAGRIGTITFPEVMGIGRLKNCD